MHAKIPETQFTYTPLESASFHGDDCLFGETLSARLVRLDGDLAEPRDMLGARGEPQTEAASIGGRRQPDWYSLISEVLAPLQALLISHVAVVPYGIARDAVGLQQDDQTELAEVVRRVGANHCAFLTEWKDEIALGATLTAMQAAHLDPLLRTIDRPLSLWEVCGSTLFILAPILVPLAIYLLNLFITKLRG